MYTLIFQKSEKDKVPFPLTEYLHKFLQTTHAQGIIVFSGYLSRTKTTAECLLDEFVLDTDVCFFGLGNPCHFIGEYKIDEKTKEKIWKKSNWKYAIQFHENHLGSKWLNINRNNKSDHSKVMAIFNLLHEDAQIPEQIQSEEDCEEFLSKIEIIGLMMGSSNFSYTTYYGYNDEADKGETDMLMFWSEKDDPCNPDHYDAHEKFAKEIKNRLDPEQNNDAFSDQHKMILFENITSVPKNYFKEILKAKLLKTIPAKK